MTNKKISYCMTAAFVAVLLILLLLPIGVTGRIFAALLLVPIAIAYSLLLKKRGIPSIHRVSVLMIMSVSAILYILIYYLTGLKFGFYYTGFAPSIYYVTHYIIPISAMIISCEIIRYVVRAQESKHADILCYIACILAEVLVISGIEGINSFNKFMDVVGITLFPSVVQNLLYHYTSKRYGPYPNIVYRLVTTLHIYTISYKPGIADSLIAFVGLLFPIIVLKFIDSLYEKRKKYALETKSKFSSVMTSIAAIVMILVIMLISNQFRFGTLVVATESMTGDLNKGDAAIFERYDKQIINKDEIIIFEKEGSVVVHRVIDIKRINGVTQYYTKGDINDDPDLGYVTENQIVGVVNFKIPYIGYATIWLRSLFLH